MSPKAAMKPALIAGAAGGLACGGTGKPVNAHASDFEAFEIASARKRRLLRQEQLILQVAETLASVLDDEGLSRSELGRRLGTTKGFVSQILAGDKNLTLRTIADVCDALGYRARFVAQRTVPNGDCCEP